MGVASEGGEEEAGVASGSGRNLWVWLVGVVERRYIDFLILLISTPLVSVLFCSSIATFCSYFFNVLCSCSSTLVIKFYVLNKFFPQNLWAFHCSHMKVAHNVLYKKKHTQTNASYPAMDINCMPSRGWV